MFLTQSDLEALTGYAQPGRQRRWLDSHHWIYENASNGRVVVSKAYAESRLSNSQASPIASAAFRQTIAGGCDFFHWARSTISAFVLCP